MRKFGFLIILLLVSTVNAQETANVEITFPPPVYVLSDDVEITGTANTDDQVNFFIEYRELGESLEPLDGETAPWFPATLPSRDTVTEDILGTWDTTTAPDGIYEIRLTVNRSSGGPAFYRVSPVRVDNETFATAEEDTVVLDTDDEINAALLALTATANAPDAPTIPTATQPSSNDLLPTPTSINEDAVVAEALLVSNVRRGDSTAYSVLDSLEPGDIVSVVGRSTTGSGWLLVELDDGRQGWIAPSVVDVTGNTLNVPRVSPPPPPATDTPVPTPTPNLPDAIVSRIEVDREIIAGEAFQIVITVQNIGGAFLPESVVFCNVEPMNAEVATRAGNLQPGQTARVAVPLRLDDGDENIRIICRVDMNESVREVNEDNNTSTLNEFVNP